MSGFPTRFLRSILGPTLEDANPVTNPLQQIPARAYNLLFHQVAGLNLTSFARAVLVASWNGSALEYLYQEEAWNSKRTQAHPALQRNAAGSYTYTFAPTYKDEFEQDVSTVLVAPKPTVLAEVSAYANRRDIFAWIDSAAPLVVQVRIFDSGGTGQDEPFLLEVG